MTARRYEVLDEGVADDLSLASLGARSNGWARPAVEGRQRDRDPRRWLVVGCSLLTALAGCYAEHGTSRGADAPVDSGVVPAVDAGMDAPALDSGRPPRLDAGMDVSARDTPDGSEPEVAPPDAWEPPRDTPADVCSTPSVPRPLGPENGTATGRDLNPRFRWLPTDPCSTYELEVDDSCTTPGFAACDFPSPEVAVRVDSTEHVPAIDLPVSETRPIGRRYYWRVRACSGATCGEWSSVRYLDVGRTDGDFDGDGCADPALTTWSCPPDTPRPWWACVHVFGGGLRPAGEPVTLANDRYQGVDVAAALAHDVNADGYGDLIVGAWENWVPGRAFLYLGGPTGLSEPILVESPTGRLDARFGFAVVGAGDLDADGYADVVVGAPKQDDNARGRVFVYLGGASGVPAVPNMDLPSPWPAEERTEFGRHLADIGDVNADGHADLAVSAAFGRVALFHGGPTGIDGTASQILTSTSDTYDAFGFAVAGGDLDDDGFADVVVSAIGLSGSVSVFGGSLSGVSTTPRGVLDHPSPGGDARFGAALAVTDIDGDGVPDVVASAPRVGIGASWEVGIVALFRGGPPVPRPWVTLPSPSGEISGHFGEAVGAVDYSCDGRPDVIVGAPGYGMDAMGAAFIYVTAGGTPEATPITLASPNDHPLAHFGNVIAGR